ncbi:SDR family NAD(P)-dependent oxidoreductase [Streptantibioticus silvisoli]|uniref:SDR family NAD(P)-dependent oxidoreductase n=1 Tax=Streptantibioticus silvisoli TaxID=2705255 RepID=UPI0034E0238A
MRSKDFSPSDTTESAVGSKTPTSSLAGKQTPAAGGSSGIGAATVRRLASRGATVAVNYRSDRKSADALVGELRDSGCAASAFPADTGDRARAHELVGAVVSAFGGPDLLVGNAGVEHFGAGSAADPARAPEHRPLVLDTRGTGLRGPGDRRLAVIASDPTAAGTITLAPRTRP